MSRIYPVLIWGYLPRAHRPIWVFSAIHQKTSSYRIRGGLRPWPARVRHRPGRVIREALRPWQAPLSDPGTADTGYGDKVNVAAEGSGSNAVARRYATALFDLADERKALDAVAADLKALKVALKESMDLRRLVASPLLARREQAKAVDALAQRTKAHELTRNFLGLLAQNRRLATLGAAIDGFLTRLAEARGEETAEVTTAKPLSEAQRTAVVTNLKQAIGRAVTVTEIVDPAILGGLIVKVGSRMVDGSLKSKLQRLERAMKGNG